MGERNAMSDPYQQNHTVSLALIATAGTPAERIFRGFLCGVLLGVALALVCGCFSPCAPCS